MKNSILETTITKSGNVIFSTPEITNENGTVLHEARYGHDAIKWADMIGAVNDIYAGRKEAFENTVKEHLARRN